MLELSQINFNKMGLGELNLLTKDDFCLITSIMISVEYIVTLSSSVPTTERRQEDSSASDSVRRRISDPPRDSSRELRPV